MAAPSLLSGMGVAGGHVMSPCGAYRYSIDRFIGAGKTPVVFIMLNPSTADADDDDPTLRRCIGFAQRERASVMEVVNLYAFRSPYPADLLRAADPVGPDNDAQILSVLRRLSMSMNPGLVICAWGAHPMALSRAAVVLKMAQDCNLEPMCLGHTDGGFPRHPLYVRADTPLVPYRRVREQ